MGVSVQCIGTPVITRLYTKNLLNCAVRLVDWNIFTNFAAKTISI